MISLQSLATDSPHAAMTAEDTHALLGRLLPPAEAERCRPLVDASRIRRRSAVARPARLAQLGGIDERTALYASLAVPLAERVARTALSGAGVTPHEVGALLVASSTGHLVPTLDQHVAARLGLAPTARRLALDGLGCAGAVRAMGTAADLLRGAPDGVALVVAVELCSLWLPVGELGPHDVQTALAFGDGAAAAVLRAGAPAPGPELVAHRSVLWPDSLSARRSVLTSSGLRHLASPRIGRVVARHLRATVEEFLAAHGLGRGDLGFFAVNPSELALAQAIADHLGLPAQTMAVAGDVWAQHGNTLSVAPLHVLRTLQAAPPAAGALGVLLVLGPGITCDLLLLRWHGALPATHREEDTPALA